MNNYRGSWAISGGLMMGLGAGFFLLKSMGALAFVGCILLGIGLGLMVASFISK